MDTRQINRALSAYGSFVGASAYDQAHPLGRGQATILNTDPSNKPGEHWVAIYRPYGGKTEYFDSFGLPPVVDGIFEYISANSPEGWTYSKAVLQHDESDSCGNHCINYVKHRLLGMSPDMVMAHFSRNRWRNDQIVKSATQS